LGEAHPGYNEPGLERLPLELLLLLVSRKGELVTRDEIARKLWGGDVYVDTNTAINAAVRKARQALRDNALRVTPKRVFGAAQC